MASRESTAGLVRSHADLQRLYAAMSENSKNEAAQPQDNWRVPWRTLTTATAMPIPASKSAMPSLSRLAQGVHEGRQHEGAILQDSPSSLDSTTVSRALAPRAPLNKAESVI